MDLLFSLILNTLFCHYSFCLFGGFLRAKVRGYLQRCGCLPQHATLESFPVERGAFRQPPRWSLLSGLPWHVYSSPSRRSCGIKAELTVTGGTEAGATGGHLLPLHGGHRQQVPQGWPSARSAAELPRWQLFGLEDSHSQVIKLLEAEMQNKASSAGTVFMSQCKDLRLVRTLAHVPVTQAPCRSDM